MKTKDRVSILELGSGQSGLIGFMISMIAKSIGKKDMAVHITDGNP